MNRYHNNNRIKNLKRILKKHKKKNIIIIKNKNIIIQERMNNNKNKSLIKLLFLQKERFGFQRKKMILKS